MLGGVDCNGPHLYSIYPHGSTDKLPYVTMGESLMHFSSAVLVSCMPSLSPDTCQQAGVLYSSAFSYRGIQPSLKCVIHTSPKDLEARSLITLHFIVVKISRLIVNF